MLSAPFGIEHDVSPDRRVSGIQLAYGYLFTRSVNAVVLVTLEVFDILP